MAEVSVSSCFSPNLDCVGSLKVGRGSIVQAGLGVEERDGQRQAVCYARV
jgi:hypothetical protein